MNNYSRIRNRLERELKLTNSFFEPDFFLDSFEDCAEELSRISQIESKTIVEYSVACAYLYKALYKLYPIIKVRIIEPCFESWLILNRYSIEKLEQILGVEKVE